MKTLFALAENNSTTNWRNGLKSDNKTSSDNNNNNSKYYSNGNRTTTTTMGAQQWHLKQLGQEFCFIFISQQTETGSCCCKIYKKKFAGNAKFSMVFSYPTRQFFLLLHIFMESWLEDGRQLNLPGEPRELITNPLDSLRTLRVWRNISMSRNHVRTMFVSPFFPCSVWVTVFAFSSVLLEFHLLRIANESFWGWAIKRAESICHLCTLPVRLKCCA